MNRAACWLCGARLPAGHGGHVCPDCEVGWQGLCGQCVQREACGELFRVVAEQRRRKGGRPPRYPPCSRMPKGEAPQRLRRTQKADYGLPFVGVAVLYLAGLDEEPQHRSRQAAFEAELRALAERWGARWREVA